MTSYALHPTDVYAAVGVLQHIVLFKTQSAYLVEAAERAMDNLLSRIDENAPLLCQVSPEVLAAKTLCNAKKTVRARWGYGAVSRSAPTNLPLEPEYGEEITAESTTNCEETDSIHAQILAASSHPKVLPETIPDEAAEMAFSRVEHRFDCHVLLSQATISQQAVLRYRLEGCDDEDIAGELGMSVGNVACLASRGISRIRTSLNWRA